MVACQDQVPDVELSLKWVHFKFGSWNDCDNWQFTHDDKFYRGGRGHKQVRPIAWKLYKTDTVTSRKSQEIYRAASLSN